ncbi:MAG: DUF1045 domain-containing protein [Patescibacteria group bacterium]
MEKIENLFGVYFNIPKQISNKIAQAQKDCNIYYSRNYIFTPHVTFYASKFTASAFEEFEQAIKECKLKPFKIKVGKVKSDQSLRKDNAFLYVDILKNRSLMDAHKVILKIANKLRGNLIRAKDTVRIKNNVYTAEETKYIKKYGFMRVLKFFRPHITLGELSTKEAQEKSLKKNLKARFSDLEGKEFEVKSIMISFQLYSNIKKTFLDRGSIIKEIKLK